MYRVDLPDFGFAQVWRDAARRLASHNISASDIEWSRDQTDVGLFSASLVPQADGPHPVVIAKPLLQTVQTALCHRDPSAPALAYAAVHRHQSDRRAATNPADPLMRQLDQFAKAVRRDIHKMHAFVRFRELPPAGNRRAFGAWFEPDNYILEAATPFFAKRFGDMDWMIATPQGTARFAGGQLTYAHPAPRPDLPDDASEALWSTYFANIFNPARVKTQAMRSEMPLKYWKNLPETRLIPSMLAGAQARVAAMQAAMPTIAPARAARILDRLAPAPMPDMPETMSEAHDAARVCTRCHLCEAATQTVWGDGDPTAPLMLVGEQPGDQEDLQGQPFVGPAGQLLRGIMAEAGTGPVWMTNAVKHFKFKPTAKRRLHQNPDRSEIEHCRWWLDLERRFVAPKLTVALGASAAYALTGNGTGLRARRGKLEHDRDGRPVLVSWHPSFILRSRDAGPAARQELLDDLRLANEILAA